MFHNVTHNSDPCPPKIHFTVHWTLYTFYTTITSIKYYPFAHRPQFLCISLSNTLTSSTPATRVSDRYETLYSCNNSPVHFHLSYMINTFSKKIVCQNTTYSHSRNFIFKITMELWEKHSTSYFYNLLLIFCNLLTHNWLHPSQIGSPWDDKLGIAFNIGLKRRIWIAYP